MLGQRKQLNWDIPVVDTFELNRAIYRIPRAEYRRTLGAKLIAERAELQA